MLLTGSSGRVDDVDSIKVQGIDRMKIGPHLRIDRNFATQPIPGMFTRTFLQRCERPNQVDHFVKLK